MATDSRKGSLEVDELELQAIEVFALPCDLSALFLDLRTERCVRRLAFDEAIDQSSRLSGGEADPSKRENQREPREVAVVVLAVAVLPPYRRRQHACCFVPPDA